MNHVSSVSLVMTASTALANGGLFEMTRHPSLSRAILLPFIETTEEPGCSHAIKLNLDEILTKFWLFHLTTTWFLGTFPNNHETARVNDTGFRSFVTCWQLTSKLDSDHTWGRLATSSGRHWYASSGRHSPPRRTRTLGQPAQENSPMKSVFD